MSTGTSKPIVSERNIRNLSFFGRIQVDEDNSLFLLRRKKAFFVIQHFVENPEFGVLYVGHENDRFYDEFCDFCSRILIDFKVTHNYETE